MTLRTCHRVRWLTAEDLAALQGSSKLRPHVHEQVLCLLQSLPPVLHGLGDHALHGLRVMGVEHIAHPLLVEMVPVLLIWEVAQ